MRAQQHTKAGGRRMRPEGRALILLGSTTAATVPSPPVPCKFTNSRGDSFDLTGIPRVDGMYTQIEGDAAWCHVGVCAAPTYSLSPSRKSHGNRDMARFGNSKCY